MNFTTRGYEPCLDANSRAESAIPWRYALRRLPEQNLLCLFAHGGLLLMAAPRS